MKKQKVQKDDLNNDLALMLQEAMEQDDSGEGFGQSDAEIFTSMFSVTSSVAMDLMRTVIENREMNDEKMDDQDIYDIFQKSLQTVMEAMEGSR